MERTEVYSWKSPAMIGDKAGPVPIIKRDKGKPSLFLRFQSRRHEILIRRPRRKTPTLLSLVR